MLHKRKKQSNAAQADDIVIGIPVSIDIAIPPPNISANAVDIEASTAVINTNRDNLTGRYSVAASERHLPVTIPKWATLCCKKISIIVDKVTIHNRLYPYCAPAAILDAQLPGSIKPTVINIPGPIYLNICRAF